MSRKERAAIAEAERVARVRASLDSARELDAKCEKYGFRDSMWPYCDLYCLKCGALATEDSMHIHHDWHNTKVAK